MRYSHLGVALFIGAALVVGCPSENTAGKELSVELASGNSKASGSTAVTFKALPTRWNSSSTSVPPSLSLSSSSPLTSVPFLRPAERPPPLCRSASRRRAGIIQYTNAAPRPRPGGPA